MKKYISVIMLIMILTSFCACNDTPCNDTQDKEEAVTTACNDTQGQEEATKIGIIYLVGNYETYDDYCESIKSSEYISEYPFLGEITEKEFVVASKGTETYAVIPGSATASVCVNELIYDDDFSNSQKGNTLYQAQNTKPIIVRCNFSDLFADVIITITDQSGAVTAFSPQISLKDGRVVGITSESKQQIKDLTHYQ